MIITLSGTMLRFVDHQKNVEVAADDVMSALEALVQKYPDARNVLFDGDGHVRAVHRLFLNGEALGATDTSRAVSARDRVEVVTAIAGG